MAFSSSVRRNWDSFIAKFKRQTAPQIMGFILMWVGIACLLGHLYWVTMTPNKIAINFFVIMLGLSLAFPSLLEGKEGLSTMRVVVFMMTNVICMLLLKIGWAGGIKSLDDIKLDQYWVGVIAFTFGAKATQPFFESNMAKPKDAHKEGMAAVTFTNAEIAKLAVQQNESFLKTKFPNILAVSDAVNDINLGDSHIIALYLKDNNSAGIPTNLIVKMPDGNSKVIATQIVADLGTPKIHYNQSADQVVTTGGDFTGSICCMVASVNDKEFVGLVTAGHIFSNGTLINKMGLLSHNDQLPVDIGKETVGTWYFQQINSVSDIAIVKLKNSDTNGYFSFKDKKYHEIKDSDVNTCKVTLRASESHQTEGFVLDYNLGFPIPYNDGEAKDMRGIILLGSANNRNDSKTISQGGDSGGCVYNTITNELIGIVLGGDEKFTYALPIKKILEQSNFKPI